MKLLLRSIALMAVMTASMGLSQDFQKCVNNTAFHFIDSTTFDFSLVELPPPPDTDSIFHDRKIMLDYELSDLYRLQNSRTQQEVKQANDDAQELDIFIFRTVLGDRFSSSNPDLPATTRLSQDLCEESTALATKQKNQFKRKRPFLIDSSLKPATDLTYLKTSPSYPSGHSLTGYLEALVLAEILPEKRGAILARAQEFARERNVLGVHYLSDIVAGRTAAYSLYEQISKSHKYQQEVTAAREEIRGKFAN